MGYCFSESALLHIFKKFLFLILLSFFTPHILNAADTFSVQAGAFSSKNNAKTILKELITLGMQCSIQEVGSLYKVSCGEFLQESDAYSLKRKLSSMGYGGAFVVSKDIQSYSNIIKIVRAIKTEEKFQAPRHEKIANPADTKDVLIAKEIVKSTPIEQKSNTVIVKQEKAIKSEDRVTEPLISKEAASKEEKVGQENHEKQDLTTGEGIAGDIFGKSGGYIHPFISFGGYYTDNVFNTRDDKRDDYFAIISPGIWITLPRIKQQLLEVKTSPISPGGFTLSRIRPEFLRRLQTYVLYRADIEQFSEYSSENMINHTAEGLFQYNFRGGLSIEFIDQFVRSHDIRGTGISRELDKFRTNLFNAMLTYDLSKRFSIRADYSNFLVNYAAERNAFRDRSDNSLSGYVFYKFLPKTAAFVEYKYIDVDYDDTILSNSKEHNFFGGLQWDITAKSKGSVKAGYGVKDMVASEAESKNAILEVQIDHHFTPKTSLNLYASRKTNETNINTTGFILSNTIGVRYMQRFTSRITGVMNFSYINDTYKDDFTFGGVTKQRKDDYYGGGIALIYEFGDWLKIDIGYEHKKRESNFQEFDYTNNTVFFRVTSLL